MEYELQRAESEKYKNEEQLREDTKHLADFLHTRG